MSARVIAVPGLMRGRGFGQATTQPLPQAANCDWLDSQLNTCAPGTIPYPGSTAAIEAAAAAGQPITCNWLQSWLMPSICSSAGQAVQPVPEAAPPPVTGVSTTTGDVTSLEGQDYQQWLVENATAELASTAPVDCTQWYNNLFNPACGCTYCQSAGMWAVLGLAGFVALKAFGVIR